MLLDRNIRFTLKFYRLLGKVCGKPAALVTDHTLLLAACLLLESFVYQGFICDT
jgi:hypothetical protein